MGLRKKVAAELSRSTGEAPSPQAINAEILRRAADVLKPTAVVAKLVRIACGTKDQAHEHFVIAGSTRKLILSHKDGVPMDSIDDMRARATRSYAADAAGWQVFCGTQNSLPEDFNEPLKDMYFVSTQDDWLEQCQILHLEGGQKDDENNGLEDLVVFVREIRRKEAEGLAGSAGRVPATVRSPR